MTSRDLSIMDLKEVGGWILGILAALVLVPIILVFASVAWPLVILLLVGWFVGLKVR